MATRHNHILMGMHAGVCCAAAYQLATGTLVDLAVSYGVFIAISVLGISITSHRLLAHRAFKTYWPVELVGSLIAQCAVVGSPLAWASLHIQHHKHTDKPGDPHSPHVDSKLRVFFLPAYYPIKEFGRRLIASRLQRTLHRWYFEFHFALVLLLCFVSVKALLVFYAMPNAMILVGSGALDVWSHQLGYRNFATKDRSTNNVFMFPILFGESWHNNHHARAGLQHNGVRWWEIDPQAWIIRLIRRA